MVPLDGTPQAAAAIPIARTLARTTQATLVLVRVAPEGDVSGEPERYVQAVARQLDGLSVRCAVRHGRPAREVLAAAADEQADVIVMATHGRVGLPRVLAGSVSESVLAASRVPVLLVRPGGKRVTRLQTLLVPTDGTAGAALALGAAVGLARISGARLELIQAVEPVPTWVYGSDYDSEPPYIDPALEEENLEAAQIYVDGIAERLRAAGLCAHAQARVGRAVATIETVADETDTDVIVMSTHALTGPVRTLLGSTADALVRTARRPVLLVRRPGGHFDDQNAPDMDTLVADATAS